MFRTTQLVTAAWICLAVVGCGGSKQVIVPLKGKVLYKGNPVTYGQVMLQPDNGIEMARGEIQPDGSFVLTTISPGDGATVGKNFVRITSRPGQKQDLAAEAAKGELAVPKSAIPAKYGDFRTSGLEFEVQPADNPDKVFDLQD